MDMSGKRFFVVAASVVLTAACESLEWGRGEIRLGFVDGDYVSTKAAWSLPDTSDFILSITDASGKSVYEGKYGDSPEGLGVSSGTYTVKVVSNTFKAPAFDTPQYGDEQTVRVTAGSVVKVQLVCTQLNCGIRLKTASSFLEACPEGLLYVKSADGKLQFSYRETRIAYFNPGSVSVLLVNGGTEETLLSRTLSSEQILTVNISASVSSSSSSPSVPYTKISVDTSRVWLSESYRIGGSNSSKGSDTDNAYNITSAKENIGATDVWVLGYIVGGDLTSSSTGISFDEPFSSRTHFAIGPRSSTTDKSSCMSVFLPSGDIRDAINLVDHPEVIGKQIYIKGDIVEAYYGIPGIKNVSEYRFK